VILTGLSGSGKSQIAIKFGQWLGRDSYRLIAVRPDWTGPEHLLGYEDALKKTTDGRQGWQVPEALAFVLRAAADPSRPYVLVLDEMNLAHVERYFADALSGIETSEPCVPNLTLGAAGIWSLSPSAAPKIPFPRNLFLIGTVNVDETTYLFSPKVLDRANTFEFRVPTDALSTKAEKPKELVPGPRDLVRGFLSIAERDDWHLLHPSPWLDVYTQHLRHLHQLLTESSLEFGHRVYYESIRFSALHAAAGGAGMEEALDRQVMQKILPRIHGSRKKVEAALCALGQFAHSLTYAPGSARPGTQGVFDPTKADLPPASLGLAFDKIRRMILTMRANQFTSFTD
jgi:5-methylcytosine-specific restriction protein B